MSAGSRGVLVTGASRGIGRAVALAFAARGDRVAVHYGTAREAAQAVRAELSGDGHAVVGADLADPDAIPPMVDQAAAALGGIDVLVNNAAVFLDSPVADTPWEEWRAVWRRTLAVNLVAAADVTYCVARTMIAAGRGGRIVNVSSRGAFRGEPAAPAYGASKAGLNAFAQSMALALAPYGIAVSAVAPGLYLRT